MLGVKEDEWAGTDSLPVNVSQEPFVHDKACCNFPPEGLASCKGTRRWWPPPLDEWNVVSSPPSKQCHAGCLQRWYNSVAYVGYVLAVAMVLLQQRGSLRWDHVQLSPQRCICCDRHAPGGSRCQH